MISNHDAKIIGEIADFNTLTLVTADIPFTKNFLPKSQYQNGNFIKNSGLTSKVSKKYLPKILVNADKPKDDKTPLAVLPTAKGVIIWIFTVTQATENHSATCKPADSKNNAAFGTVINLLPKDLLK